MIAVRYGRSGAGRRTSLVPQVGQSTRTAGIHYAENGELRGDRLLAVLAALLPHLRKDGLVVLTVAGDGLHERHHARSWAFIQSRLKYPAANPAQ
jgi:hypothetical protein